MYITKHAFIERFIKNRQDHRMLQTELHSVYKPICLFNNKITQLD